MASDETLPTENSAPETAASESVRAVIPEDHPAAAVAKKPIERVGVKQNIALGGCLGANVVAAREGVFGQFVMRAATVPAMEPPPPITAKPLPANGEIYGICDRKEIRDRMGKSFPLMRRYDDGSLRPWDVFVARFGKEYHAYVNECPHQHVRLDWEKNNFFEPNYLKTLMCGKHGAAFDPETGVCISGPCQGAQLEKVICFVDEDGDVCLAGINIDLYAEVEPVKKVEGDEVLENNGFKLQSTKREFL
jgi:nitrite reductase/ring-hydroxylating ferredoxin subunit